MVSRSALEANASAEMPDAAELHAIDIAVVAFSFAEDTFASAEDAFIAAEHADARALDANASTQAMFRPALVTKARAEVANGAAQETIWCVEHAGGAAEVAVAAALVAVAAAPVASGSALHADSHALVADSHALVAACGIPVSQS